MTNKVKQHIEFYCLFMSVYFNSFGSVYIPQEELGKIKDKSTHIFEIIPIYLLMTKRRMTQRNVMSIVLLLQMMGDGIGGGG